VREALLIDSAPSHDATSHPAATEPEERVLHNTAYWTSTKGTNRLGGMRYPDRNPRTPALKRPACPALRDPCQSIIRRP
jgi:hypothetical protein